MEINCENTCRLCLKGSENMVDIFILTLKPGEVRGVDFIRKMTDVKLVKGEYLPNNICTNCIDSVISAFNFAQMCIASDELLKKEETRREFRKIEEEALLDDENEIPVDDQDDNVSVKCEGPILHQTSAFGFDDISDHSELEIQEIIEPTLEKVDIIKPPVQIKDKYKCQKCSMSFSNKTKFLGHQKTHDESKPFKCLVCFQTFLKEVHLKVHFRSHAKLEEKKFNCKICGKHFIYEYLLKQHKYKHSDKKPFPCSKCDKGCLTSESLRRHMKIHDENYIKKAYVCTICRKEFPYPSSLSEHMKNHTGEKPHLCSICGKGFRQSGALHFHQRIHSGLKPFQCKICGENFMSQSILKVHMRKHTNERPFICDSCGMSFRQSTDLKSHMRTHTGERPVLCTVCGKKMATTGQLKVHLRSHTGEKPFSCKTCSRAFTTKTMLQKHERIHTGERPYVCTICHKAFNQSSTLKTHTITHRSNSTKTNKVSRSKKNILKGEERATIKINVPQGKTRSDENVKEFTVILPAPIPLLSTSD